MKKAEQVEPINTLLLEQEIVKWKNQPSEMTQHCLSFIRQRSHLLKSAWMVNRFSMVFKVKSINTVDIAGKQVDGMKRPREPPTGGNKMDIGRILPTEAAAILNVSPQFVRVAMQQGKLPIGTAVQMSSIWTYHISEKLLADYSGKNIEKEIERIRGGVEK